MTGNALVTTTPPAPATVPARGPADHQQMTRATPENSERKHVSELPRDGANPAPVPAETMTKFLAVLRETDPDGMREYEKQFDPAKEAPYYAWFLKNFVPSHLREYIPDDAGALHLGAAMGRWHYHQGDALPKPTPNGENMTTDPFEPGNDPLLAGIENASPENLDNRIREANRLFFNETDRTERQRIDDIRGRLYAKRHGTETTSDKALRGGV